MLLVFIKYVYSLYSHLLKAFLFRGLLHPHKALIIGERLLPLWMNSYIAVITPLGAISSFTRWKLVPQPNVLVQRDAGVLQPSLAYLVIGFIISSKHFKLCLGHSHFAKRVHVHT